MLKGLVNLQKSFEKNLQALDEALRANTMDLIRTLQASSKPIESIVKAWKGPLRPLRRRLRT